MNICSSKLRSKSEGNQKIEREDSKDEHVK